MSFSPVHKQAIGLWSPDGQWLAAVSQGRVLVRDADTLKLAQVFACCDKVERIEWSPDSEYILAEVPKQSVVQVWSARDAAWRCRIDEGLAGVACARWARDSRHVLVTSEFQLYISAWPLEDGAVPVRVPHPKHAGRGVAFSRAGGRFLAVLRRWDCRDSVSVHAASEQFAELITFHVGGDCADVMWAPDDSALVLWERPAKASRFLWYSLGGELLAQVDECALLRTAIASPTASWIAAACFDGSLHLVACPGRKAVARFAHNIKVACAEACGDTDVAVLQEDSAAAPQGLLGVPGGGGRAEAGGARYVRAPNPAAVRVPEDRPAAEPPLDGDGAPRQGICWAVWSPDERFVATKHEGMSTAVWVWDIGRLALAALLLHASPVRSFAWDPSAAARGDATRLAVSTAAGPALLLWSPGAAAAAPTPLAGARLQWRCDGLALLLQERDHNCVFSPGPPAPAPAPEGSPERRWALGGARAGAGEFTGAPAWSQPEQA